MRKLTTVAATALIALMAACSNAPTLPSVEAVNAGPRYDGGFTMGSGNFVGEPKDPAETETAGTDTPATETAAPSEDGAAGGTTERGGFTMGSGN